MATAQESRTPTARLGDELVRVVKLIHVARQRAPRQHPSVDPMAYPLLFNLSQGPMRVSALAEVVHADVSTVSRQVSTLVEHGFVERTPDPDDGRAQVLGVTEEGAALLQALRDGRDRWMQELLADWSAEDVSTLTDLLARFAGELTTSLTTRTDR